MANYEQTVREAAANLKKAIDEATAAGYRVAWPGNVAGLDTIAISETAAVKREPDPATAAATTEPKAPPAPAARPAPAKPVTGT